MTCDASYTKLFDRVLLGELAPADWERLRGHLKACEPCRGRYDRAVLAERMLHGGPAALDRPSPSEFSRIEGALFGAERQPAWQRVLQWFQPTARWATGALAVAATVVLVPFLVRSPRTPRREAPSETLQARGAGAAISQRPAALRAFCLTEGHVEELSSTGSGPQPAVPPRCALDAQLKLAIGNAAGFQRVFLVGVDDAYDIKWYSPHPPETLSVEAPRGNLPIGGAVRLSVHHAAGPLRLFALFSDAPLSSAEVQAAVRVLKTDGRRPSQSAELPLPVAITQRSLLVDVER